MLFSESGELAVIWQYENARGNLRKPIMICLNMHIRCVTKGKFYRIFLEMSAAEFPLSAVKLTTGYIEIEHRL